MSGVDASSMEDRQEADGEIMLVSSWRVRASRRATVIGRRGILNQLGGQRNVRAEWMTVAVVVGGAPLRRGGQDAVR